MPNFAKLWLQKNLNEAATKRALEAIENGNGWSLPCTVLAVNGSIVTVTFNVQNLPWPIPPITMPKLESQWVRTPTQVGDLGFTVSADTFLGAMTGLGSGIADLRTQYSNLGSRLVFCPLGNSGFTAAADANKAWVNGPAGAIVGSTDGSVVTIWDQSGKALSLVVPSGGFVGLGALVSALVANQAVLRAKDLTGDFSSLATVLQAWGAANFASGTSTPPAPTMPTVTGSSKARAAD